MLTYRRKLPHIHSQGHPIFLTWRLHGSVPVCKKEANLKSDPRPGHASLVAEALKAGETVRGFHDLHAWVVMPNHVHVLITPRVPLPEVTRWLKCSTAYQANQILKLTGRPFWRQESWDRWVRDSAEFNKIVRYIERNPVSAGFVEHVELWRWSSGYRAGPSAYPT